MIFSCSNLSKIQKRLIFYMLSLLVLIGGTNCKEISNFYSKPIYKSHSSVLNHFGSLLGSGRTLSFPFAAGLMLSIVDENIWNVSTNGFPDIFNIRAGSMGNAYGDILDRLNEDSKSTLRTHIYLSNYSDVDVASHLASNTSNLLDSIEFSEINWADTYWRDLDDTVSNETDGKLERELFPRAFGRIFDVDTEAAILNTFHYKNSWKYDWKQGGNSSFGDGSETANFIETSGEFLVSEEDEFTAVAVPLKDAKKSIVFVLPTYNLTKHFRVEDEVPLPHNWVKRTWRIKVPEINFTKLDQYGKELQQLGINETFCTSIHDRVGRFPYYLRPIVQANYVDFNSQFLQIASATGTAVQNFALGADLHGNGHPWAKNSENSDNRSERNITIENNEVVVEYTTESIISSESAESEENSSEKVESTTESISISGASAENGENSIESIETNTESMPIPVSKEIIFDRPFLWYINDVDVGPIFFGFVNSMAESNPVPMKQTSGDLWKKEITMVYLWSCKSFAKSISTGPSVKMYIDDSDK